MLRVCDIDDFECLCVCLEAVVRALRPWKAANRKSKRVPSAAVFARREKLPAAVPPAGQHPRVSFLHDRRPSPLGTCRSEQPWPPSGSKSSRAWHYSPKHTEHFETH